MRKLMLNRESRNELIQKNLSNLSPGGKTRPDIRLDMAEAKRILRRKRSDKYMEALKGLDVHAGNSEQAFASFLDAAKTEFMELPLAGILLGIVAKCYLGPPYEVHTLSMLGSIIQHFKAGQALPQELEKARVLAKHPAYQYIEVYPEHLCAISADGSSQVLDI